MIALLALIAFVIAMVVHGGVHGYIFWMLLGLALLALDITLDRFGVAVPYSRRRV